MAELRVLIVGASTGLGRCLGVGLAQRGAKVALMARRQELLDSAVAEAGPTAVAICGDATDQASTQAAVAEAAERMGGIDAVVYSAALGELRPIEEIDPDTWHRAFAINVVGASTVISAALPHLAESKGMVVCMTSVSASLTSPWPGLASYTVTKAALDKLVDAWRAEHHEIGFTRLVVGECAGGEGEGGSQFTAGWDPELAGSYFPTWVERGLLTDKLMDVEHFTDAVEGLLKCGASAGIPSMSITPRRHF